MFYHRFPLMSLTTIYDMVTENLISTVKDEIACLKELIMPTNQLITIV